MKIKFVDGSEIGLIENELAQILGHRHTQIYIFATLIFTFAANPFHWENVLPAWFWLILWPISGLAFSIVYFGTIFMILSIAKYTRWEQLYEPFIMAIALTIATLTTTSWGVHIYPDFTKQHNPLSAFMVYNFVLLEISLLGYLYFLFDPVMKSLSKEGKIGKYSFGEFEARRIIHLAGSRYDVSMIQYIQANDHYLNLRLQNAHKMVKANLAEVTAQTTTEDGFLVHRSYWIARHAIHSARKAGGRIFITVVDGTEIPVARPRQKDVMAWLIRNGTVV